VDGVSRTVWLLSKEQARLGHDVTLLLDETPDQAARDIARESGLKLIDVEASYVQYPGEIRKIIDREQPQIVHMHSVFVIKQALLGKVLNEYGIPYVITPHGGLAPQVLRRGVVKKTVYAFLRERPRFMRSSAVALVTPAEERAVRSFIPHYRNPIRWMPNPVEVDKLDPHRWHGLPKQSAERRLVYLGRFDVLVKGIDILIEIARLLPEMNVDLYGTEDPKTREWLYELKKTLPGNVTFHDPIFGVDKARMLSGASLYLQPSRWEGFPVSVAECLFLGVPAAIADTLDLAQLFYQHGLGLVMPLDPPRAAAQIRAAMEDEARLQEWSERGRQFAMQHFHPTAVANNHVRLYQEVIDTAAARAAARGLPYPHIVARPGGSDGNGHTRDGKKGMRFFSATARGSLKSNVSRMIQRTSHLIGTDGIARTVVLCYHSVNPRHADLAVHPDTFRSQLQNLREMDFEFMDFGSLVYRIMRWGAPKNNVACVSFDDGYEDNLTVAAPILAEMKVPATVFVTSGLMAHDPAVIERFRTLTRYETAYLSPRQVRELSQLGFEIGAHSHTHRNMSRLSHEQTREEVVRSKSMIEDAVGKRVVSFAYPFGKRNIHYTPTTVATVRESGFTGAAAVAFRSVTTRSAIRVFEIPRFFVTCGDSSQTFRQKVLGHFDWLGSIQEGTPGWLKAVVSPEDRYAG
jgi:glycosyltransferase involved in cell wall biosynthesis/peptidoglycan/xylan/chitin deacetylase (PgdA/CDA1 family)